MIKTETLLLVSDYTLKRLSFVITRQTGKKQWQKCTYFCQKST